MFSGIRMDAYLPNNPEGREVLALLEKAFEARLILTLNKSNKVVWNSKIHHKTSRSENM